MPARLIKQNGNRITVQFTIDLTGQMLKDERALQQSLNEAGQAAMVSMIKQFDTNGEPLRVNGVKHTMKSYAPQDYETPYGPVQLERYTYQTSKGGRVYVPLENDSCMILNSTPNQHGHTTSTRPSISCVTRDTKLFVVTRLMATFISNESGGGQRSMAVPILLIRSWGLSPIRLVSVYGRCVLV